MNIDERLEALTMNLELAHRDIQDLRALIQQDAENIRALAVLVKSQHESIQALQNIVIAHDDKLEEHDQRLDRLEQKPDSQ